MDKKTSQPTRPKPLLTDEEIEAGDIAFVELVKKRQALIEEAKRKKWDSANSNGKG